jgi:hypothetical protein
MRKALNENPMVQIAVLGVAAIAFAVILFTSVLKKDDTASTATDPAAATSSATGSDPAQTTSDPAATADSSAAPTDSSAAPTPTQAAPPAGGSISDGLLPSKGLPSDVLVAFAKNETIALLVIDPKGMSDEKVEEYTRALRNRDDVRVFIVDVKNIADYSRVTIGATVNRVPALVVIRPRKLTGSVPTASVSYGFRDAASVNQAIDDAVYKGKQIPSYP